MVPMQVGDQDVDDPGAVGRFGYQGPAQVAQARTGITNNDLIPAQDLHTGSVVAISGTDVKRKVPHKFIQCGSGLYPELDCFFKRIPHLVFNIVVSH